MASKRITERVAVPFTDCKVNREGGYIDDVLICGLVSLNGRDYPDSVHARDHKVYEGRPVNTDHGREATVDRRLGWFSDVTHKPGSGSRGRFNLLKSHPMYERVMEAAERNPSLFGLSHVADCKTTSRNGRDIVEGIEAIESIDLVADPATTKGFFESTTKRSTSAVNKISLKQFCERFGPKWGAKKWSAATKVIEDMGDIGDAPVMDEPPADAPEGDLKDALMAALAPMLDEAFDSGNADKVVSALKDFIKLHAKHTGKAADAPEPKETPEETAESKKPNPWDVLAECQSESYVAGPAELKLLAQIPLAADRKAFIQEQKAKRPADRTQSAERRPGAGAAGNAKTTESKDKTPVPTDGAAFAKSLRA